MKSEDLSCNTTLVMGRIRDDHRISSDQRKEGQGRRSIWGQAPTSWSTEGMLHTIIRRHHVVGMHRQVILEMSTDSSPRCPYQSSALAAICSMIPAPHCGPLEHLFNWIVVPKEHIVGISGKIPSQRMSNAPHLVHRLPTSVITRLSQVRHLILSHT